MRKLPASSATFIVPMITAAIMTFLVTGISSWLNLEFDKAFFSKWMMSWGISWLIAFPTLLVSLPIVKKLVSYMTEAS